jgi:hypothetical protein
MSIQLTTDQIAINVEVLTGLKSAERHISSMLKNDYLLFCNGNAQAETAIVEFWNACEQSGVLAKVRTQLSAASKEVHKELGINVGMGAKVSDGKIVLATNRNKKSKNPLIEKAKELAAEMSEENQQKLAALLDEAAQTL